MHNQVIDIDLTPALSATDRLVVLIDSVEQCRVADERKANDWSLQISFDSLLVGVNSKRISRRSQFHPNFILFFFSKLIVQKLQVGEVKA